MDLIQKATVSIFKIMIAACLAICGGQVFNISSFEPSVAYADEANNGLEVNTEVVDGVTYTYEVVADNFARITEINGTADKVVVPATFNDGQYNVAYIGDDSKSDGSVVIANTINSLDVVNCEKLLSIFCKNSNIKEITITDLAELSSLVLMNSPVEKILFEGNVNLDSIFCSGTNLTNIDLSSLTKLRYLDCSDAQIQSLSVATNEKLELLRCSNNKIASLDLTGLTNLEEVFCDENPISSIVFKDNSAIKTFNCIECSLTSLDVSSLINLEKLYCNENKINNLSLINNNKLKDLSCVDCGLTSLDLSNLTKLEFLVCQNNPIQELSFANNPNLNYLILDGCDLASFDISNLSKLKTFGCSNIKINELSFEGNPLIEHLGCVCCGLASLDVSNLVHLKELICAGNDISSLNIEGLNDLVVLDCSYNNIEDTSALEAWLKAEGHDGAVLPQNSGTPSNPGTGGSGGSQPSTPGTGGSGSNTPETPSIPDGSIDATQYPEGTTGSIVTDQDTGATTTTTQSPDGTKAEIIADKDGKVESVLVELPEDAAADNGRAVIPITKDTTDSGADIQVKGKTGSVLEIPSGKGTVAVIVNGDGTTTPITKSSASDGSVLCEMPDDDCVIRIESRSHAYPDVPDDAWYKDAAEFLAVRGIVNGISTDGGRVFAADTGMSRSMFATVLHNIEYNPTSDAGVLDKFDDASDDEWYSDSLSWAAANDLINGYGNGTIGPNDTINREQIVTILMRYADMLGKDTSARTDLSKYHDADKLSFGKDAMSWAVAKGIVGGYGDTGILGGSDTATRAQVCAIIQRFIGSIL